MKNHRTFRHFKINLNLPPNDLQAIIDCARQAPSWMNGQHYNIINITSPQLRAKIGDLQLANPKINTCSSFLVFVADLHRASLSSQAYDGDFAAAGEAESLITAITDVALAAQNAVVAAESLGYGTCFIGGIRNVAAQLVSFLHLPKHTFPIIGLCIGTADIEMRIKPRLPENVVYSENQYPDDNLLKKGLLNTEKQ